jgi:tetratricopeptide (TPR) repeat protein
VAANNLAALLLETGNASEALGLARRVVDARPEVPAYHGTLALALARAGRHRDSLENAGRATTLLRRRLAGAEGEAARGIHRQLARLEMRRAESLIALGEAPAARTALEAAAAADPSLSGSEEYRRLRSDLGR